MDDMAGYKRIFFKTLKYRFTQKGVGEETLESKYEESEHGEIYEVVFSEQCSNMFFKLELQILVQQRKD